MALSDSLNFNIRYFNLDADYATINTWWERRGSHLVRPEFLPSTGIITEIHGKPVTSGFLYRTDSKICVFEFVSADPDASKEDRDIALAALIEAAKYWAKQNGFGLIYSSIGIPIFIGRLEKAGFIKADTNQTHMFCELV